MATFTAFSNILPDPAHPITDAGDASSTGTPGPGFSALGFQSVTDTQSSRTISGRGIGRDGGSQHWEFNISYNPMFRYQFDPVDSFLTLRNPRKDAFYVVLPQYSKPKDAAFATWYATNSLTVVGTPQAGASAILLGASVDLSGKPKPGDMFTLTDPEDYNHQKVYKVGAVETSDYYQDGTTAPTTRQFRIHFSPPLNRSIIGSTKANFIEPKFRVISKSDVHEYQLDNSNLYSFSLAVEEFQP